MLLQTKTKSGMFHSNLQFYTRVRPFSITQLQRARIPPDCALRIVQKMACVSDPLQRGNLCRPSTRRPNYGPRPMEGKKREPSKYLTYFSRPEKRR